MIEIVAVVVGAVLGYGAGWVQQRTDRSRRRKGLASAMLLELRRVERTLREISSSDHALLASIVFPLSAHKRAMEELDLFEPPTTAALFDFLGCVADVEHGMALFASGALSRTPQRDWEQQSRAAFAANRVDAVKAALFAEGGRIAPERDISRETTHFPDPPRLDPPGFPQPIRPA